MLDAGVLRLWSLRPHRLLPLNADRRTLITTPPTRASCIVRCLTDDPALLHGLPVGLQLVGRTLEEEGVIAMTELVVAAIDKYKAATGEA